MSKIIGTAAKGSCELSVTKRQGRDERCICIKIQDGSSRGFVEVQVPLATFADCITGLVSDGTYESFGLNLFGMEKIQERRKYWILRKDCKSAYDKTYLEGLLVEKYKDDPEWTVSAYLGSQSSISSETLLGEEYIILNYWVYKYV